jgi:hypothetical protein
MVPKFANSTLTECVLVKTSADTNLAICNLVFPNGGSKLPIDVGIVLNRCCKETSNKLMVYR